MSSSQSIEQLLAELRLQQRSFHVAELFLGFGACLLLCSLGLGLWLLSRQKVEAQAARAAASDAQQHMDVPTLKRLLGQANMPAWLRYPDHERVAWIDTLLGQLWPHAAAAAASMVQEQLGPLLEANRPSWMTDIALHTFTLGDVPPSIQAVKVYPSRSVMDEVIIELDVSWVSKAVFQLLIKPLPKLPLGLGGLSRLLSLLISMRVGVSNLYLSGRVRLSLAPLLNRLPVVAALTVSLVEEPVFSYSLMVQGGDLSFLPGLEAFIGSFVRQAVLRPYVLPEGLRIPLSPDAAALDAPKGILFVRLVEAQHVPWLDWWSRTDSYVKLGVRQSRHRRSRVMLNNLNPRWDEHFELLVHHPEHQRLTAVLMDANTLSKDEPIGQVQVPLTDLEHGQTRDLQLELQPPAESSHIRNPLEAGFKGVRLVQSVLGLLVGGSVRKPCTLHMEVTYFKVGADEVDAASGGTQEGRPEEAADPQRQRVVNVLRGGVLSVSIRKSMQPLQKGELPPKARQVRVTVGSHTKSTAEMEGTEDPDFEEILEFFVAGDTAHDDGTQVVCEIYDYHWISHQENLTWAPALGPTELPGTSKLSIPLRDVLRSRKLQNEYELPGLPTGCVDLELSWLPVLEGSS